MNPVGGTTARFSKAAPRVANLDGRTIGLWWNFKVGGDVALQATEKLLASKFTSAKFKYYKGSVNQGTMHVASRDDIELMAKECDVVVGTTSD